MSSGALHALNENNVRPSAYLYRHLVGDWGDLDKDDWARNDRAALEGGRILSAYTLPDGRRLYVITEEDRSATSMIMSDEY